MRTCHLPLLYNGNSNWSRQGGDCSGGLRRWHCGISICSAILADEIFMHIHLLICIFLLLVIPVVSKLPVMSTCPAQIPYSNQSDQKNVLRMKTTTYVSDYE